MADNNTHVNASTDTVDAVRQKMMPYILLTTLALAILALLYGATSWWVIKKFRNYKNFVFLKAILTIFVTYLIIVLFIYFYVQIYTYGIGNRYYFQGFITLNNILIYYLQTVKMHWLIVISHMFYVDIVKVVKRQNQRKYFKSVIFAWILPFITNGLDMCTSAVLELYSDARDKLYLSFIFTLILNTSLYIMTVCTVFRISNARSNTTTSKWRRLCIATFIFILSDILMFHYYIFMTFHSNKIIAILNQLIFLIYPLLVFVYFVFVKRNRVLWYELYVNKLNEKQRNRDFKDVENVRPTTDSEPAVST